MKKRFCFIRPKLQGKGLKGKRIREWEYWSKSPKTILRSWQHYNAVTPYLCKLDKCT